MQANKGTLILCATSDWVTDRRMQRMAQAYAAKGFNIQTVGCKREAAFPPNLNGIGEVKLLETKAKRGVAFYAEFNFKLLMHLLSVKAEVVFSADADTLPACSLASTLTGANLIYDAHEWFSQVPELKNKPLVRFFWDTIERAFSVKADQVFTVAPILSEKLSERLGGRTVHCIPNYPGHWKGIRSLMDVNDHTLVYLGVLNEGRGLELAIEAVKGLPVKLKIIGVGDIELKLKLLASQLPEGQVVFTGRLDIEEIQQACEGSTAGLMLLDAGKSLSYNYSLANKFFDYVQMGLPVIANPLPEYAALAQEFQVLIEVEEYSSQALRRTILNFIANKEIVQNARLQCKKASQVWVWKDEIVPDLP